MGFYEILGCKEVALFWEIPMWVRTSSTAGNGRKKKAEQVLYWRRGTYREERFT